MAATFDRLPPELVAHVLHYVRRDRRGNETVPGHVAEALSWRPVCRRFRQLSRTVPSEYDGAVTTHTSTGCWIRSFTGGKRFTPRSRGANDGLPQPSMWTPRKLEFHIVRVPMTGELQAVGSTRANPDNTPGGPDEVRTVHRTHCLRQLLQLLSGHNADYDTRLDHFDAVAAGLKPRLPWGMGARRRERSQSVTSYETDSFAPINEYDSFVGWMVAPMPALPALPAPAPAIASLHYAPDVEISTGHGAGYGGILPAKLTDALPGETVAWNTTEFVPGISVALGIHDAPDVAECGGWITSLFNHGLPKELRPKHKPNDPELSMRILARAALDRAERERSLSTALVTANLLQLAVVAGEEAGPSAVPSARPRSCTARTKQRLKEHVEDDNTTHASGRKHAYTQDWDSKEDEALGLVDDSVANPLDPESEDEVHYDSDGEWRPSDERKPRSKSAMARERLEEERKRNDPTEIERLRRLMMVPSDDEDDDAGRPPEMMDI